MKDAIQSPIESFMQSSPSRRLAGKGIALFGVGLLAACREQTKSPETQQSLETRQLEAGNETRIAHFTIANNTNNSISLGVGTIKTLLAEMEIPKNITPVYMDIKKTEITRPSQARPLFVETTSQLWFDNSLNRFMYDISYPGAYEYGLAQNLLKNPPRRLSQKEALEEASLITSSEAVFFTGIVARITSERFTHFLDDPDTNIVNEARSRTMQYRDRIRNRNNKTPPHGLPFFVQYHVPPFIGMSL